MPNDTLSLRTANSGMMLPMDRADAYRIKAAELSALAKDKRYRALKAEFEQLAHAYLRLIEQAEHNSHFDIAYETPLAEDADPQPKQPERVNKTVEPVSPSEREIAARPTRP